MLLVNIMLKVDTENSFGPFFTILTKPRFYSMKTVAAPPPTARQLEDAAKYSLLRKYHVTKSNALQPGSVD